MVFHFSFFLVSKKKYIYTCKILGRRKKNKRVLGKTFALDFERDGDETASACADWITLLTDIEHVLF